MGRNTAIGFTIIEMMIVIALLSIVVSIAIPSYLGYVIRTNRAEGIEALMAASACQERLLIRTNAYSANACGGATQNGHYNVTFTTSNGNQNYVATAAPQGSQTKDDCGSLTLSDAGVKAAGGQAGAFAQACWSGRRAASGS